MNSCATPKQLDPSRVCFRPTSGSPDFVWANSQGPNARCMREVHRSSPYRHALAWMVIRRLSWACLTGGLGSVRRGNTGRSRTSRVSGTSAQKVGIGVRRRLLRHALRHCRSAACIYCRWLAPLPLRRNVRPRGSGLLTGGRAPVTPAFVVRSL